MSDNKRDFDKMSGTSTTAEKTSAIEDEDTTTLGAATKQLLQQLDSKICLSYRDDVLELTYYVNHKVLEELMSGTAGASAAEEIFELLFKF